MLTLVRRGQAAVVRPLARFPCGMHVSKPPSNDATDLSHMLRCSGRAMEGLFRSVPGALLFRGSSSRLPGPQLDEQARPHDNLIGVNLQFSQPSAHRLLPENSFDPSLRHPSTEPT